MSGTPDNDDVGSLNIKVSATDAQSQSASDAFTLTVDNTNDTPTVSSAITDTTTNEDAVYSYNASANFSDVDTSDTATYTATFADDSVLPDWLTITSTGVLSGTPLNADVGSIDIKVTRTDTAGASVSDSYTLTVNDVNDTPPVANNDTITIGAGSTYNIIDVLANDTGGSLVMGEWGLFVKNSAGNNLFDVFFNGIAKNHLYENGVSLIGEYDTGIVDGVEWTRVSSNTDNQHVTTFTNSLGYIETSTEVWNEATSTYDEVGTTNKGTYLVFSHETYQAGGMIGTWVIDISGTFAFNEADIRTLTNVDFIWYEDTDGNELMGGTATLNGEEVTFGLDEVSSLEVTSIGNADNGTVTIVDGEIQYTPNANFSGTDSFAYIVTDSVTGEVSTATVTVNVILESEPVVANNDTITIDADSTRNIIDVLSNDTGGSLVEGDDPEVFIKDSADNNLFYLIENMAAKYYYLWMAGLSDNSSMTIDGVEWTMTFTNDIDTYTTVISNSLGYVETHTSTEIYNEVPVKPPVLLVSSLSIKCVP